MPAFSALFLCQLVVGCNPFDSKLQVYYCKESSDAASCSGTCEPLKDTKIGFNVNVDKSYVSAILYDGNKQVADDMLENCKVIDKNNWACETFVDAGAFGMFSKHTRSMSNGRYSDMKLVSIKDQQSRQGICAK